MLAQLKLLLSIVSSQMLFCWSPAPTLYKLCRNPRVVVPARLRPMFWAARHHRQAWAAAEAEEGGGAQSLLQLREAVPGGALLGPHHHWSCPGHQNLWYWPGSWARKSSHGKFHQSVAFCWKSTREGNCYWEKARGWIIQRTSSKVCTSWGGGAAKEKRQRSADFDRFEVSNLQEDIWKEKVPDGSLAKSAQLSNPQGITKMSGKTIIFENLIWLLQCGGCETRFKYREEMVAHQAQCQQLNQIRLHSLVLNQITYS